MDSGSVGLHSGLETADGAGSFFGNAECGMLNAESNAAAPPDKGRNKKRKRGPVSEKQMQANKANAARSTGPRTAEGKAKSSLNAVTYGLFADTAVLPGEDAEEFEALASLIAEDHRPKTIMEQVLLGRFASITWKLQRLARAEEDIARQNQHRRIYEYVRQCHLSQADPDRPLPDVKPEICSSGGEIFADDFMQNEKQGPLQKITQLEIRLTGQMLSVSRQLTQTKKQQMAERKEGVEENAECGVLTAECPSERFDDSARAAQNEPISEKDLIDMLREAEESEADQPRSGDSTIALGASPRNSEASIESSERAPQEEPEVKLLLQSSRNVSGDPGVPRRPAAAAPPQAMVETSRWDCMPEESASSEAASRSPAQNEPIRVERETANPLAFEELESLARVGNPCYVEATPRRPLAGTQNEPIRKAKAPATAALLSMHGAGAPMLAQNEPIRSAVDRVASDILRGVGPGFSSIQTRIIPDTCSLPAHSHKTSATPGSHRGSASAP
jgi:hypothetical protein